MGGKGWRSAISQKWKNKEEEFTGKKQTNSYQDAMDFRRDNKLFTSRGQKGELMRQMDIGSKLNYLKDVEICSAQAGYGEGTYAWKKAAEVFASQKWPGRKLSKKEKNAFKDNGKQWMKKRAQFIIYFLGGGDMSLFYLPHNRVEKFNLDISFQREIAINCYKLIASGDQLTPSRLRKLVLTYCIKKNIPLKPDSEKGMNTILNFSMNDETFTSSLKKNVKIFKSSRKRKFWPTNVWCCRFMARFNLRKNLGKGTMYSKSGLLCQLVPSLEMTYVLRELLEVPGGEGRILNIDESMTYRYDLDDKTWTY